MSSLRQRRTTDKSEPDPANWPDWTDNFFWEPDEFPTADEARWWARHAPGNADGYDVEPDVDERARLESAALDSLERSFIPADLAELISSNSPFGPADAE